MFSSNSNVLIRISDKFRKSDTNLVYIFTNARDEPNIAEWIAHHLLLGFDKVFVFDHLSKEPIQSKINTNFNGKLVIHRVTMTDNVKLLLMQEAVNISNKHNVSWMLYLDADEFLLLNKLTNIKHFLTMFKEADAIGINWLMFGSNGHVSQPNGLLTNNFTKSDIRLNPHVKSFVRPSIVKSVPNPHFYNIVNPNRYFTMNGAKMAMNPFNPRPLPFIKTIAYIAHYYVQSEDEYLRRKGRALDDGSSNKTGLIDTIHTVHNEIINKQLQVKYAQKIAAFLKQYNIVL
jgi:hypothetical protein